MSVELEPFELAFRRPFNHEVIQILRLRNPHSEPVAFKVKTTAPKQYCVRPNSGTIEGNKDVEIQVLLQAMKEDPPADAKCRDKFLVQSAPVGDATGSGNIAQVWSEIEKGGREHIKERKIRVIFLPAHDTSTPQREGVNGVAAAAGGAAVGGAAAGAEEHEAPPTYRSPSPNYDTPAKAGNESATAGASDNAAKSQSTYDAAKSTVVDAGAAASATLSQQLTSAQATIKQLKDQIAEQGLRQRKTEAAAKDSRDRVANGTPGLGTQTTPAEGVPVQLVAALCLLSFLLAYFFF